MPHITFIHVIANKPQENKLKKIWLDYSPAMFVKRRMMKWLLKDVHHYLFNYEFGAAKWYFIPSRWPHRSTGACINPEDMMEGLRPEAKDASEVEKA